MTVYKGKIITCDKEDNVYNYLVEDKGVITYVGDTPPEGVSGELVELEDKALIPTFVDTHSHFASYAVLATAVIIGDATSFQEIKDILIDADKKLRKDKTIIAFGANTVNVREGRLIDKALLDQAVADRYIFVISADGHTVIVNSKTLNKLPMSLSKVRGYNSETGIIKHEAFYKVVDNMPKFIKKKDIFAYLQSAIDALILKGIGMVHAASGTGFPGDLDVDLLRWIAKGQDNGFQMRVFFQTFDTAKVLKRGLTRLGGCFATALDGSIGSRDAALIEPFEGTDNKGILYYPDDKLYEYFAKAHNLGLQVQTHAIGDAAFDQATRVWKKVLDSYPRPDHRHGIIHASLVTEEGMNICRDYGIQILAQPAFIDVSGALFEPMYKALGERVYDAEPHKRFIDAGIIISAGSDAPVTIPDPVQWLYKACNNPNTKHRLTINEALKMCTYNGYYATFDEKKRGSLEKGKIADMVILSRNPYRIRPEELNKIKVEKTILKGKEFVSEKKSVFKTILKGMIRNGIC